MKKIWLILYCLIIIGFTLFVTKQVSAINMKGKIRINNIWLNDFTGSNIAKDPEGNILIEDSIDFQIVYLRDNNAFLLSILNSPFSEIKLKAEKAFFKRLGVSRSSACKLNVTTTTLYAINPDYANQQFVLPFCSVDQLSDVDENCKVEKQDVHLIKAVYFYEGFDKNEDINADGEVNALDLSYAIKFLGTRFSCDN